MTVEIRIYNRNPAIQEYETISSEVPAFWPVPRINEYISLDLGDIPSELSREQEVNLLKVITVNYEMDSLFTLSKIVITTERS